MSGVKKHKKHAVQIQESEEEISIKEKEMVTTSETVVRTVPVKNSKNNNSIVSYSHGMVTKFENHELPKGYKPKAFNVVSTQKSCETKNLKMKDNPDADGIKGFTNNLKVALQMNQQQP